MSSNFEFPIQRQTRWLYHLVPFIVAYVILNINILFKVSTYVCIYRAISTSMAGMAMAILIFDQLTNKFEHVLSA